MNRLSVSAFPLGVLRAALAGFFAVVGGFSAAQDRAEPEIPLQLPRERQAVEEQEKDFLAAMQPSLAEASRSMVRIWENRGGNAGRMLAYGTVIGDGRTILTKWSQIARAGSIAVEPDDSPARPARVTGVHEAEDIAVLTISNDGEKLTPVRWSMVSPEVGTFIAAPRPGGKTGNFGVISVLERNLRETDRAFLGVTGDPAHTGKGVRISEIQKDSGAAAAGLKRGDVILKISDRKISGILELRNAMNGLAPGSRVAMLALTPAGEKTFSVLLGNREAYPKIPEARLNAMELMGGPVSRVRDGFPNAVQTDMRLAPNQTGGPVVDLQGNVIGITLARTDRTRSFFMPAEDIVAMLERKASDPLVAKTRRETAAPPLPEKRPEAPQLPRLSRRRVLGHLAEMKALMDYMDEEIQALEENG